MFKKKNKSLIKEYIFIDTQRLEAYMAQIKGDVKYDVNPIWNIGLSATSPVLGTSIQKVARKPNYHEMIKLLMAHLRKSQQLSTERASIMLREETLFCYEPCMARKVIFPTNLLKDIPGIKELALWISIEPDAKPTKGDPAGPLYLIESYSHSDNSFVHAMSGYTAFHYMFNELGLGFKKSLGSFETDDESVRKFGVAPHEYLAAELKAQVSDPRYIECLYRRRATMVDLTIHGVVTFGYPIFIAEMPWGLPT